MSLADGELGRQRGQRRQLAWTLGLLLLAAVAVFLASLGRGAEQPTAMSSPGAAPAAPAATAEQVQPAASAPITVDVRAMRPLPIGNGGLFGRKVRADEGAADAAVREVGEVVEAYLNAEFVTAATRFSDQPLADLLTPAAAAALTDEDRAALGALGITAQRVEGAPVAATARVLTRGDRAAVVTVDYDAQARVHRDAGDPVALRQRATMAFVPMDGTWRADAVDAELDLPAATGGASS